MIGPLIRSLAVKDISCDLCGYRTYLKSAIRQHMRGRHIKKNVRYKCHICNKFSADKTTLRVHHIRCHTNKSSFKCEICSAQFSGYDFLFHHVQQWHQSTKWKVTCTCDVCGMEFYSKSILEKHMKKYHAHPFKCFSKMQSKFPKKTEQIKSLFKLPQSRSQGDMWK